ncbi:hypothetical protein CEXT_215851 [Caerostris extrusa]|uniref:Uncharacterized protein n=1 Tax=Caerostris extrusa TaxID=172846 RepID=A0AAV4QHN2_CAEEX|nr:hypothetical protein CEXT_215851 [Caerostris extrusa]
MILKKTDLLFKRESELKSKQAIIEDLVAEKNKKTKVIRDEKLWACQKELKNFKSQIKCLLCEKLMYESNSSKYEREIKNLKEELRKSKLSKCPKCQQES